MGQDGESFTFTAPSSLTGFELGVTQTPDLIIPHHLTRWIMPSCRWSSRDPDGLVIANGSERWVRFQSGSV